MRQKVFFDSLSKYRAWFMGIAIVLVMLCHNTIKVPDNLVTLRMVLSSMCQCGVDVFMLLSGLGLYYSFHKDPDILGFWKKRFTKILIPYIIVVVGYAFVYVGYLKRATIAEYLWEYSLISFFVDAALRIWFVAAILVLYGIFPVLYNGLQRSVRGFCYVCCGVIIACIAISYLPLGRVAIIINEIFVSRIPVFMVGMVIAKLLKENKRPALPLWCVAAGFPMMAAIIIWVILSGLGNWWTIARLLFMPFVLFGMLLLGRGMDKWGGSKRKVNLFAFLGGITFELFLLHDKILATINDFLYLFRMNPIFLSVCANILAIGLSLIGAWILHRLVEFLTTRRVKAKPAKAK